MARGPLAAAAEGAVPERAGNDLRSKGGGGGEGRDGVPRCRWRLDGARKVMRWCDCVDLGVVLRGRTGEDCPPPPPPLPRSALRQAPSPPRTVVPPAEAPLPSRPVPLPQTETLAGLAIMGAWRRGFESKRSPRIPTGRVAHRDVSQGRVTKTDQADLKVRWHGRVVGFMVER